MIDWMWLDADGAPLLQLYRQTAQQTMVMKSEGMPEITTSGQVITTPFTGIKLFVGSAALVAGSYTMTIGTYGQRHQDAFDLQRELMRAAMKTAYISRNPGGALSIAAFSRISRSFRGDAQLGGANCGRAVRRHEAPGRGSLRFIIIIKPVPIGHRIPRA